MTLRPDWNNPLAPQEIALPLDTGAELFGPGDPIVARLHLGAIGAIQQWRDEQPIGISPRRAVHAHRKSILQSWSFAGLPVLRRLPGGPSPAELVRRARRAGIPAVLFAEDGDRNVLAVVNFRIARPFIVAHRRRSVPGALIAARVGRQAVDHVAVRID